MKATTLVLILSMVLCLTAVLAAELPQQTSPAPAQQQLDPDRFEDAHGQLLSTQDKGKEASRLTEAVAPALPATAAAFEPVPRKNFVDEFIFGKIERDRVPHAPIAGDE